MCGQWAAIAAGLAIAAATILANRHRFDWAFELSRIPAIEFAIGLSLAGLLIMPLPRLIERTGRLDVIIQHRLLLAVIVVGIALRGVLFATEPILEDDYYRYLWDGGVAAHGINPYALAPSEAPHEPEGAIISRLASDAGIVLERINHPDLKTIYPPVAQAAFALAHWIKPWSMTAWRSVCLGGELVTLGLLIALLNATGRSPLWVALYWWNPLVIKELVNSAHMEAIVLPLVFGALLLGVKRWPVTSVAILGLAIGAKVWPAMLAPLLLRPLLGDPKRLFAAVLLLGSMTALWAMLPLLGGLDATSGFVAYASYWKTNSALFPALERLVSSLLATAALDAEGAGQIVRGIVVLAVGAIALRLAARPWASALELMRRASIMSAALFLLSPAQFPWYATWTLPFLCFLPSLALLGLTVTLPFYYASFYFHPRDIYYVFRDYLVWLIWLPIWSGLMIEGLRYRRTTGASETANA